MTSADTAREYHSTARAELTQRIGLRDNVLMAFLGGTGALFSIAFGTSAKPEILLVVPYLTLGAAVIISQHHEVIGALGDFLRIELHPFLTKLEGEVPEWDSSKALTAYHSQAIWMRTVGHSVLLIVPSVAALAINWPHRAFSASSKAPAWWFGLVFAIGSCVVIGRSHFQRRRLRKSLM